MKPRILVLRAAGINCDVETEAALARHGADARRVHVNRLLARDVSLDDFDMLVVPGGFSYGDDVGAGRVLAVELAHHLRDPLLALIDRGGLVLGVCNGFQVLVKLGLLPGVEARIGVQEVTLTDNDSDRYEDRWVQLEVATSRSVFLPEGARLRMPVAHGEGKYVPRDGAVRRAVESGGHVALRYVAPGGGPARYPDNPNGSVDAVAGLVDATGRVFGLMPHPERALLALHRPDHPGAWAEAGDAPGDGDVVFERAVSHLRG